MTRHYLAALTIGLFGLAASAAPGNASEVIFTSTGTCSLNCAIVGAAAGDTFSVTVGIDSSKLFDGKSLTLGDIESFSMHAGTIALTQNHAAGLSFMGLYNAATHDISDVFMFSSTVYSPTLGDVASVQNTEFDASIAGNCDPGCTGKTTFGSFAIATNMTRLTAPVSSVPEPAAWAMLLAGFGTLGASIRTMRRLLTV